jgi:membrane-associated protease RseP (regulator of RpoE activity)
MGVDSSNLPEQGFRPLFEPGMAAARPRRRERWWLHLVLFLLTVTSTLYVGADFFGGFYSEFGTRPVDLPQGVLLLNGVWYSASALAILGAHEMGHYFACRYHGVDASPPYFLPAPRELLFGTLGAFIRIRQTIPSKRELFDIGIAGPIAGFIVAVPLLLLGMSLSQVVPLPTGAGFREFGEPLLFQAVAWLCWGTPPDGYSINAHPMVFAAWFGMLATTLNLFPIGQLDGGHISYAVLGRKSTVVTLATVGALVALTFVSLSWLAWTVLTIVMLFVFGPHHPRTIDEDVPLDTGRLWLAFFALVIFVLCFTPAPIDLVPGS